MDLINQFLKLDKESQKMKRPKEKTDIVPITLVSPQKTLERVSINGFRC